MEVRHFHMLRARIYSRNELWQCGVRPGGACPRTRSALHAADLIQRPALPPQLVHASHEHRAAQDEVRLIVALQVHLQVRMFRVEAGAGGT